MQIIGGPQYDPGAGPGSFSAGPAAIGGQVILHNLSTYDLLLTFNNDDTRQALLHAWQPRKFNFCGKQTLVISYSVPVPPSASAVAQAPTSYLWGESYTPGEEIPESFPNYDRLSNVGNTVTTQGGSANVKNDGNGAGTQIIEATPSDQSQSSVSINNDASGFLQILSANVLRTIWSFIRGNNTTTKASLVLGDVGDPSILTFYGVIGAGSRVPLGALSTGVIPAGITIPYSQVTGTPAGTSAASAITPTEPGIPTSVYTGSKGSNADFLGFRNMNGQAGISGLQTDGEVDIGATIAYIKINNYYDGTDRFMTSSGLAIQYIFSNSGTLRIGWRYSTNPAVAGTAIAWSGEYAFPIFSSAGGGVQGATLWQGTADPAVNAQEGDLWSPR